MKKLLNTALLFSFLATVMVPLTGMLVHKLASVLFLALTVVHTLIYRRKLGITRWLLLGLVLVSFVTGLLDMIREQLPGILILHRCVSIGLVFFQAIHIFLFRKKLRPQREGGRRGP